VSRAQGGRFQTKLSPQGFVTLEDGREVWEVNLYDIAASAVVIDDNGTVGPVAEKGVEEKRRADIDFGARAFIVATRQPGLDALGSPLLPRECQTVYGIPALLDGLRAERVTARLRSRRAGAHFSLAGSVEFACCTGQNPGPTLQGRRLAAASACKWLKGVFAPAADALRLGVHAADSGLLAPLPSAKSMISQGQSWR
jgi:hypothetical protein